jgi:RNA polymerase sigma factor (sigma-70 family)
MGWEASDESLLAGMAAGDPDAAATFVRRFQGRVFGLALVIVGDRDTAQEVAQETFVRAWRHAAAYDPRRGRVTSWLLTIARNAASDARRLRRAEPTDPETMLSLATASEEPDPEDQALTGWETHRLRGALISLPEEQRRALLLAAFYGWTAQEISDREGIPLGTAKTRIRSAMHKLRSLLEVDDER